jgi:cysteinyl-tRNA synthetase
VLRVLYPRVTYVRNITDVDDKINARAKESGEPIGSITARTTADFHADMAALGVLPPDEEPRATQHIAEMVQIIERLIASGHAYAAEGHVLFSVPSFPAYGRLSGHSPDELLAGARIDVAPYKRDPGDFVLWKPSTPDIPGWDSPWGRGRPGWHIECSAMSWRYLGETFDIHGGGTDLIFPHHENELAQSVCAFPGSHFARYWVHSGMLNVDGVKMSKSLGNFFTIRDLLADWPGEVLRLNMLKTHYRSPLDWTVRGAEESAKTLDDWYGVAADVEPGQPSQAVIEALYDDLNTAQMMAVLHGLRNAASASEQGRKEFAGSLKLLGFLSESAAQWEGRKRQASGIDANRVNALIADRTAARARKDFKESDRIRDELAAMGVAIKDSKEGTTWEVAR